MQKSKRSLIKNFYAISYTVGLYRCWSFLYVPLQTKVSFICRERRDKLKSVSHNDRWHTKKCLPYHYCVYKYLQVFDWTDILSDLPKVLLSNIVGMVLRSSIYVSAKGMIILTWSRLDLYTNCSEMSYLDVTSITSYQTFYPFHLWSKSNEL